MTPNPSDLKARPLARKQISQLRHVGGFILAGSLALVVDIAILTALMSWFAWPAAAARIIAIAAALIVSWWINRTVTFAIEQPPSVAEFGKFAAASWLAQCVNYTAFLSVLSLWPGTAPAIAIVIASTISMAVAYLGFRFAVFRS